MWSSNSTNSGRSRGERRFADAAGELRRDQRIAPGSQTAGWLRPCMGPSESTDARCSERPQSVCPTCDAAHLKRERLRRGGLVAGGERRFAARSFRARLLSCKCCERATVTAQAPGAAPNATAAPARAERYSACTNSTLRRPSRPSQSGRAPVRIAHRKSSSTRRCPRTSDTTGDVALALVLPASAGGGCCGARSWTETTRSCSTMTVPSEPVSSTRRGNPGNVEVAASTFPGFPRRVELTGSEGTVIVEHDRVVSVQLRAPQHPPPAEAGSTNASATSPVVSDVRGHRRVLEDFLCAIRTGARPLCDGREGRRSVELVQALYRSARAGAAVALGAAPGA